MKNASILMFLLVFAWACKKDDPEKEAPSISTGDAFVISGRGTVITGTISSAGGYTLTEAGIVYGTNSSPTTADVKAMSTDFAAGTYPLEFGVTLREGFPTGTIYYRAYTIGEGKIFYGDTKRRN
jgi:translation elongation factor EF-Tu-like GTPase